MLNITIKGFHLYYMLIVIGFVPVETLKSTRSLYDMADDYEDDKNSVIAIKDKEKDDFYDDFYLETDVEYVYDKSMDIIFYGPPETFLRLDPESILHILCYIKLKHLIPINKVLQAWDIITDGRTAAFLQGREYLAFGPLLNFVPEEDLYYANMGDWTVRNYFAHYSKELHFRKFGILVAAYRRYYGDTWYLNASTVNQLGYMICGFPPSELIKISPAVMKELKGSVLNKLGKCNDKQVKTLYNLAVQPDVFGEPYRWTSNEVSRLGSLLKSDHIFCERVVMQNRRVVMYVGHYLPTRIICSIPANELSSIQLEAMPAITEEVIKEFSQQKLTQFTKQQIMKMHPLTRRIYILRVQLLSSLDVNEVSKRSVGFNNEPFVILIASCIYMYELNPF